MFPTDEAVYDQFSTALTPGEREQIIAPLFDDTSPYVGYRCLAAMARSRPIFVVNLNWDNCVTCAGERVGVTVKSFDLKDVEEGRYYIDEAIERGNGVVCAHVHGYLAYAEDHEGAEEPRGIRFSLPDTLSFSGEELTLLQKMLAPFTIVAGTSLIGPHDTHDLLQALLPAATDDDEEAAVRPLWVFERGDRVRAPGFQSRIAIGLSSALLVRHSIHNFVGDPDVDFDTMMMALRAHGIDLQWSDGLQTETSLPAMDELLPPNAAKVRPLLDEEYSLVVGVPRVGTSALAYRLAWWRCLTDDGVAAGAPRVRGFQGPAQALDYLKNGARPHDNIGAIVIEDVFDERDLDGDDAKTIHERLAETLAAAGDLRVVATARPDAAVAACKAASFEAVAASEKARSLHGVFKTTVVCGRSLWKGDDLRAWARARGGDRAQVVCREVRMGSVLTPSQAVRTLEGRVPHEWEPDWKKPLRRHLDVVYDAKNPLALLLAMLRLQDFSIPRSEESLISIADRVSSHRLDSADELIDDPWGLCATIEVDGSRYVRLSHPGVICVVDDWIATDPDGLAERLAKTGEEGQWGLEALKHWRAYRSADPAEKLPEDFDRRELELFSSEYVARALQQRDPALVLDVLRCTWGSERDHWVAKDVALDLVLHWEDLPGDGARALRDALLKANREMGAYALFEAILRTGRPVATELWSHVVSRVYDLAAKTRKDPLARHQVALCFDALMWRPCPVNPEQERGLIRRLEGAVREDTLLRAAVAAAASYHIDGAKRLRKAGFEVSAVAGGDVSRREVAEMVWMVAWHFVHQSRCRALASRRTFLSTVEDSHAGAPRYLDRAVRQDELDEEFELPTTRLVDALLRFPDTAGWALHLIMNLQTTTGMFTVPEDHIARLDEALTSRDPEDAVISAAITYAPSDQMQELVNKILSNEKEGKGKAALQEALGEGVPIEGTWVSEPRFAMGTDPWRIRDRWRAGPRLPFSAQPRELIESLAACMDEAVADKLVEREVAERALTAMRRGQTQAAEAFQRDRRRPGEKPSYLGLWEFIGDFYSLPGPDAG